jgi:hypothetical protein
VQHSLREREALMSFLDINGNGYVDFHEFSKRVTPDIDGSNQK